MEDRDGRTRKTKAKNPISKPPSCKKKKIDLSDLQWTSDIPECPIYHPSEQEFQDPFFYIQKISPEASKFGICKIVSPITASIPAAVVLTEEKKDFKFKTTVQPLRLSKPNAKHMVTFYKSGRKYTYHEFETLANKVFLSRFHSYEGLSSSRVEKEFWGEMTHGKSGTVEYGFNIEGSAFSCDPDDMLGKSKWNLKNISRLPQSVLRFVHEEIPGITDPMLYIGMLFSMFAWHVEDHYLYSINYHHSGANKIWYGVPGHEASKFENVVLHNVHCNKVSSKQEEDGAYQLLAHKTTMFPPIILLQNDVQVYKAVQKPGEFVITFPRAYHSGFSTGFTCGEAVNFATDDWFPQGAAALKRHTNLRMLPIIPYEELVCKEAMQIYESLIENKDKDLTSYHATILCFLHLMQFYENLMQFYEMTFLRVNDSKELSSSSNTIGPLICQNCPRDCYLAYMMCEDCYSSPICLYHDIAWCSCGKKYTIYKRDDMLEIENAAKIFEQVHGEMNCGCEVNTFSLSSLFSNTTSECIHDLQNNNTCHEEVTMNKTKEDSIKLHVGKKEVGAQKLVIEDGHVSKAEDSVQAARRSGRRKQLNVRLRGYELGGQNKKQRE